MRIASATFALAALCSITTSVYGRTSGDSSIKDVRFRSTVPLSSLGPDDKTITLGRLPQQQGLLSQIRGGGAPPRLPVPGNGFLARARGGRRSSDTAVLIEALAETALESGMIVGFVGAAEYLTGRFAADKFVEVARLATWTASVFLSGAATAGPKRWLDSSQLFNIDTPISEDWYAKLRKPSWNPPNWVFPIMWVPLKILQVFACVDMWDKLGERSCLSAPVVVYAVYKSLGDVWNKVFFERRRLKMGTVVISLYYATLLAGIKIFKDVSDTAGYLFAPTAAWVTVATALQWSTYLLNRNQPDDLY